MQLDDLRPGDRVRLSDPPAGWSNVVGVIQLIDHAPQRPTKAAVKWDNGEHVYEQLDRLVKAT